MDGASNIGVVQQTKNWGIKVAIVLLSYFVCIPPTFFAISVTNLWSWRELQVCRVSAFFIKQILSLDLSDWRITISYVHPLITLRWSLSVNNEILHTFHFMRHFCLLVCSKKDTFLHFLRDYKLWTSNVTLNYKNDFKQFYNHTQMFNTTTIQNLSSFFLKQSSLVQHENWQCWRWYQLGGTTKWLTIKLEMVPIATTRNLPK